MVYIINLFFIILSFEIIAADMKELSTKQTIGFIRFISFDNKVTYYQNSSGSLMRSKNFITKEIYKDKEGSQYYVNSSSAQKKMIYEIVPSYLSKNHSRYGHEIYIGRYGDIDLTRVGEGISPQLHLDDTWISYYKLNRKLIILKNLINNNLKHEINIQNNSNPFFTPQAIFFNNNQFFYTDINNNGVEGVFLYDVNEKKSKLVFKTSSPTVKIELCLSRDKLVIGQFGLLDSNFGSIISISSTDGDNPFEKTTQIYSSPLNDIGSLVCLDQNVYFSKTVKNIKGMPNYFSSEIFKLNLKSTKTEKLTNIKNATHAFNMDGRILVEHLDKYYVLVGESKTEGEPLKDEKSK